MFNIFYLLMFSSYFNFNFNYFVIFNIMFLIITTICNITHKNLKILVLIFLKRSMFSMFFLYISASCGSLVDFRTNQKNIIFLYCHNAKLTNIDLVCYDFLYLLQNMLDNIFRNFISCKFPQKWFFTYFIFCKYLNYFKLRQFLFLIQK